MIFFLKKGSIYPKKNPTGILIEKYISVQATIKLIGYNFKYLRRLLRAGKLEAHITSQLCLISLVSLEAYQTRHMGTDDHRYCQKKAHIWIMDKRPQAYTHKEITFEHSNTRHWKALSKSLIISNLGVHFKKSIFEYYLRMDASRNTHINANCRRV